jgi:hypothetical protein
MLVLDLSRILCHSPELFRLIPGGLGRFCLLAVLLWRDVVVVWHVVSSLIDFSVPGGVVDRCSQRDSDVRVSLCLLRLKS